MRMASGGLKRFSSFETSDQNTDMYRQWNYPMESAQTIGLLRSEYLMHFLIRVKYKIYNAIVKLINLLFFAM